MHSLQCGRGGGGSGQWLGGVIQPLSSLVCMLTMRCGLHHGLLVLCIVPGVTGRSVSLQYDVFYNLSLEYNVLCNISVAFAVQALQCAAEAASIVSQLGLLSSWLQLL